MSSQDNDDFDSLQNSVFSRWINSKLKGISEKEIKDLKDLTDGVILIELSQVLTKKNHLDNIDKVQNCDLAINMLNNDGANVIGISGKNVNDGNIKLILGLVWTLISHYPLNNFQQNNQNIQTEHAQNQNYSKKQPF